MGQMTTYCVDVSGSMSHEQIMDAMDKVSDDWQEGDRVIIFDHASAEFITFEETIDYALGKDSYDLRKLLFKKGAHSRWGRLGERVTGPQMACRMAFCYSTKVILSDCMLAPGDINLFNRVVKIRLRKKRTVESNAALDDVIKSLEALGDSEI